MPFTMGGLASGIDTEDIIKKLVQAESAPIVKLQQTKGEINLRKKVLGDYETVLQNLQKAAKELYGFRAAYDEKKAISSNEAIVTATASKLAQKGSSSIKVLELAGIHKISSDEIDSKVEIPAGSFELEVNGDNRPVKFRGGTLQKLREKIEETAGALLTVNAVNTEGDKWVLTLESKVAGKAGEILIRGDKDLLKKAGLIKGEREGEQDSYNLVFDNKYFVPYAGEKKIDQQDGSLNVAQDGKSVSVKGLLWREMVMPLEAPVKKDTVLTVDVAYTPPPAEEQEDSLLPYKIETGPDEITTIKGIDLHGYNISRERPLDKSKKPPVTNEILGVGVVADDNGKRIEKIYAIPKEVKGKQEFPVGVDFEGKKISRVIFYCGSGEASFSNGALSTPIDKQGLLEAKNTIVKATDAKIVLDGVQVVRGKNEGITDLIKGVTVNLKNADPEHAVTIRIDNDIDNALKKAQSFTEAYNRFLGFTSEMTKTSKIDKPGDFQKVQDESGLFVGDMMIIRLSNQMKTLVGGAYPSRAEKPVRTLSQVGLTTGKINSSWDVIKEGKLECDVDVMRSIIEANPEGVRELFGSDNDGDNRTDNGFAYQVDTVLEPYVRPGKNIIAARIDQQNDELKRTDDAIARGEDHLKAYESKLRQKFAAMEKSVTSSRNEQSWMKQQMGSSGGQ